jgi:membrane protease YdiL (CAAX protease family)
MQSAAAVYAVELSRRLERDSVESKTERGASYRRVSEEAPPLIWPFAGVLCAIAATTAMDATGLSNFSAFALLPLMFLFWWLNRLSRVEVGFRLGYPRDYALAVLFPIAVMGIIILIALIAGAVDISRTNLTKVAANLALLTIATFLVAIVTEEGFFRGWLWGSLEKTGMKETRVLIWSSTAFALWHISAVTLDANFKPPPAQIPIYLLNAAVVGAVWGLMRASSGSIIVSSLSHGLWNGMAYVLFGFGVRVGALGIRNTSVFGPENGLLGLSLNLIFACLLWGLWKRRGRMLKD